MKLQNKNGVLAGVALLSVGVGIGACVTQRVSQPSSQNTTASIVGNVDAPLISSATAAPPYEPDSEPIVQAVRKAAPAVVSIDTTARQQFVFAEDMYGEGEVRTREVPTGAGSGVLLENGYALTNQHVVGDAVDTGGSITLTLADGRQFKATTVGADRATDIALLRVQNPKNLPTIPLGTKDALTPGQTVIAIGNPVGLSASVSSGVVSALGRPLSMEDRTYENLIQTDTAINPGNSGGALIDLAGRLVGINTLVRSDAQNIGFAIPLSTALRIADSLKEYGKVRRPDIGVVPGNLDPRIAQRLGVSGVGVAGVFRGSPAATAGLRRNDVIISINGKEISDTSAYRKTLEGLKIGQTATLNVWRRGETGTTKVQLAEAP
ncbi:MAG: trypsin-like peptidase domain-containing protein [Akkermansiaceae bacterium]|nr:trypsin-like peptidase domain-containing protein [Armatimonadota bacterium]